MNIQERIEALDAVGVKVHLRAEYRGKVGKDRQRVELPGTVSSVVLPFTAEEWVAMCMREPLPGIESAYMGGCCGNMGVVQDVMNGVFRDGGVIDADELSTIGPLLREHDGWEAFVGDFDVDSALSPARWEQPPEGLRWNPEFHEEGDPLPAHLDSWGKVCVIHAALEEALKLSREEVPSPAREDERHPGANAMRRVESTLRYIGVMDLFSHEPERSRFVDGEGGDESFTTAQRDSASHEVQRRLGLAKLVPVLRELLGFVESDYARETVEAVALVKPGTDEVLENGRGLCLYGDVEAAQYVLDLWARWETEESQREQNGEDVHEPVFVKPEAEIVRVCVSVQDGLEVLR